MEIAKFHVGTLVTHNKPYHVGVTFKITGYDRLFPKILYLEPAPGQSGYEHWASEDELERV